MQAATENRARFTVQPAGAPAPAARQPASRTPLAPLDPRLTRKGTHPFTGRASTWGAVTKDHAWEFERVEDTGTTWSVIHRETRVVVASCMGTLSACRAYVSDGTAQADLERLQAHQHGEHAGYDRQCPECDQDRAAAEQPLRSAHARREHRATRNPACPACRDMTAAEDFAIAAAAARRQRWATGQH
jgi:hypothetical protein